MSSGGSRLGLEKSCRSRLGRRLSSRAAEADPSKASLRCRSNENSFPGVEPCLDGVELIQAPTPSVDYAAVPLGDLHAYDPAAMAWTDLSAAASGTPPSPRDFHGLASAGGLLYVFGGWDGAGGCLLEPRRGPCFCLLEMAQGDNQGHVCLLELAQPPQGDKTGPRRGPCFPVL